MRYWVEFTWLSTVIMRGIPIKKYRYMTNTTKPKTMKSRDRLTETYLEIDAKTLYLAKNSVLVIQGVVELYSFSSISQRSLLSPPDATNRY